MPSEEPNPKMDKLLRDYAKQRRAVAGPLEMHAATRKMLQGEVARTLAKTAPATEAVAPKVSLWPRLIWAGAALSVLAIVFLSFAPLLSKSKQKATQFASAKQSKNSPDALSAPAPAAYESADYAASPNGGVVTLTGTTETRTSPAQAKELALKENLTLYSGRDDASRTAGYSYSATNSLAMAVSAGDRFNDSLADKQATTTVWAEDPVRSARMATADTFATAGSIPEQERLRGFGNSDPDRRLGTAVVASPAAQPSIATNFSVAGLHEKDFDGALLQNEPAQKIPAETNFKTAKPSGAAGVIGGKALSQNYVQQDLRAKYRQNLLSPPQPKVLSNFQVVWNEPNLKIIDEDGSIYEGEIKLPPASRAGLNSVRRNAETTRIDTGVVFDAEREVTQNVNFRVSGENRTLHQQVVFEGTNLILPQAPLLTRFAKKAEDVSKHEEAKVAAAQAKPAAPQSKAVPNVIEGSVSVGGTNQFRIQALEAP